MDYPSLYNAPFVNSILHPTDFSEKSANAFAHALAIALVRKTQFTILHVQKKKKGWQNFPAVRSTLERWGFLEKGSSPSDVMDKLSIQVEKVGLIDKKPLTAIIHFLDQHLTDLIVLSTQGREGVEKWVQPSLAERLAKKSKTMTLFVPHKAKGFVSLKDGVISIQKILLPIDYNPNPLAAIEYATRMARTLGKPMEITLLHVALEREMPAIDLPEIPNVTWNKVNVKGEVVPEILKFAENFSPDVMIMPTAGHKGFLDAIRGGVTERVLRKSPSVLLAVPMTQ